MEESPFRVSIHVKKSYIQDFSPKLSADLPWSPNLNSTSQATENDSGLPIQESSLCSSCLDKEKELEDVRREVVKVLVDSNENNDKLEMAKLKLTECNENLKKVQNETIDLKNEIKTKAEQLKQKNKKLESINSKLEKCIKDKDASFENFNNKISNLEMQNLKSKIEKMKLEAKNFKSHQ